MVFPMFLSNINQMDLPATWQAQEIQYFPRKQCYLRLLEGGGKLPAASSKQQFHPLPPMWIRTFPVSDTFFADKNIF